MPQHPITRNGSSEYNCLRFSSSSSIIPGHYSKLDVHLKNHSQLDFQPQTWNKNKQNKTIAYIDYSTLIAHNNNTT